MASLRRIGCLVPRLVPAARRSISGRRVCVGTQPNMGSGVVPIGLGQVRRLCSPAPSDGPSGVGRILDMLIALPFVPLTWYHFRMTRKKKTEITDLKAVRDINVFRLKALEEKVALKKPKISV